jgi:hypothetical protein
MQYVLGNMLNGGGINPDGLSLDLQFAADKTLTARKGPTPVFTRGSTGTFVGSNGLIQTAAIDIPRFDHDSAGVCRGLLIEESRTNSLKFSENLTNTTNWSTSNQTITLADVGPDGITNSAAVLNEGTSGGQHSVRGAFGQNRPVMGAVSCTLSAFFKAGTRRYILFAATDAGTNGAAMTIDTQTWSVTDAKAIGTGFTYTTNRLTNYGGGWYRAELTFTPSAATTVTPVIWGTSSSTFTAFDPTYTGNSSTIIAYGVQLEAGSFATSYIPTTTGTLARSADVCSITGGNFTSFYNQSEGTSFVASERISAGSSFTALARYSDNTNNNRINIGNIGSPHNIEFLVASSGIATFQQSLNTTAFKKAALAYKSDDANYAVNGSLGTQDNTVTIPSTVNQFDVQAGQIISSIRYYRKRLPNAKLAQLTV